MQPHRSSALGYASAASAVHSRVYGACTAEAAASESSRLSVGGCIRARRYFGPYPVRAKAVARTSVYTYYGNCATIAGMEWIAAPEADTCVVLAAGRLGRPCSKRRARKCSMRAKPTQ